jgi:hypothetical protein
MFLGVNPQMQNKWLEIPLLVFLLKDALVSLLGTIVGYTMSGLTKD